MPESYSSIGQYYHCIVVDFMIAGWGTLGGCGEMGIPRKGEKARLLIQFQLSPGHPCRFFFLG